MLLTDAPSQKLLPVRRQNPELQLGVRTTSWLLGHRCSLGALSPGDQSSAETALELAFLDRANRKFADRGDGDEVPVAQQLIEEL